MSDDAVLVFGDKQISVPLDREVTIGRAPDNDVVLSSSQVSRRHARLRPVDGGWLLVDEGSANGSFVGGNEPVAQQGVVVGIGAQVRFGDVVGEIVLRGATESAAMLGRGASHDAARRSARRPRVFVSYSRHDARVVDRLVSDLRACGIQAWVDRTGLVGSADWTAEIVEAVEHADGFLLALSRASVESDDVANELHLAGESERPIFPVLLESVQIPPGLAYHLAGRQRYDLSGDSRPQELDRLIRAIRHRRPGGHRRSTSARRVVAAVLTLTGFLGAVTVALSVLTGSIPPDLGRITGSHPCSGLDLEVATQNVTEFVEHRTAHLAVTFRNSSTAEIDASNWSVAIAPIAGEPYRFVTRVGIEPSRQVPAGEQAVGRMDVEGVFGPSTGSVRVIVEISDLRQGDSIFARCRATTEGVVDWDKLTTS
jgi:hypothetical protein